MRLPIAWVLVLVLAASLGAAPAGLPPVLQNVGIDQKLGQRIPADLVFTDETGASVRLGDYFRRRPVVLTLVYYQCPMLCTMVLNDLLRTLRIVEDMDAGRDFDIVTISFDPREQPALAAKKKQEYLRQYSRPTAGAGWHFLTGDETSIEKLTSAVGFRYEWDEKFQQYAHPSGIMILTPDGMVSRYFLGLDYPPKDFRQALVQASGGGVGPASSQIVLFCFHYDPYTGKYTIIVRRALQLLAGLLLVVMALLYWRIWSRPRRSPAFAIVPLPGAAGGKP